MARASKIVSLVAAVLLALLALPIPTAHLAEATVSPSDVWVAPTGNDSNPGTKAQPFATIQKGIDTVEAVIEVGESGTVHVASGTYHENLRIYEAVNLIGAGAQNTIVDGGSSGAVIVVSSAPNTPNAISGFTIQNGAPFGSNPGGGIYIGETHIVTLNDCVIKDNEAEYGGGIYNQGHLYMNRCTVSGNSAQYGGGGIYNTPGGFGGQMWLTNCTISGNEVTEFDISGGGGIYNYNGTMRLLNCTIAYNSTTSNNNAVGGGFYNYSSDTMYFKNTIVANNTAGNHLYNNGSSYPDGATVSQGHNLDSENSCDFNKQTDLVNTNPRLGPLQDNGGSTFTHALLQGSPAIGAGTNAGAPSTDQRGVIRPQGVSCDIGAYELVPTPIIPPQTPTEIRVSPTTTSRPLNPPQMSLQYLSVNPQQTSANQPVTISTNVVNTGDEAGNINVALKINGLVEETRMVSVGPQGTQPVKFTVSKAQPGTYNVTILDKSGSFTILGTSNTTRAPVNGGLIAILIIGVLVLATVMVLLLTRSPA